MRGKERTSPRVVVVGAGIIGVSIAVHLALYGTQVTIIDVENQGRGAQNSRSHGSTLIANLPFITTI